MRDESVAVLDIRSGEISLLIGSKGVNGTFVLRGFYSEKYEGYSVQNGILDVASFRRAVSICVNSARQNYDGEIKTIYVGVPSGAIRVQTKGHANSYPRKRKISSQDVDALYESGLNALMASGRVIRRSDMYFTLGDNRKYFDKGDLYGVPTTMLKGALCYYFIEDTFYESVSAILRELQIEDVHFIPSTLAQSIYLIPQKKREDYAFLLDIGYRTSSFTVIYGNGIVHEESFDCGVKTVLDRLVTEMQVDFSVAEEMLATTKVTFGNVPDGVPWNIEQGKQYSAREINEHIKWGIYALTQQIQDFFAKYYKDGMTTGLTVNPIGLTGEGVLAIQGISGVVSNVLDRLTEVVAPDLPYYDKPTYSSHISLLNMALLDRTKESLFYKILNYFGGKRK